MSKAALILSGGGSKGAYEAGVVSVLQGAYDEFPVVGGTSTGSLISTLVGTDNFDLLRLIYNGGVDTEDIVRPIVLPKILSELGNVIEEPIVWLTAAAIAGKMGIYSIEPLMEILEKNINFEDVMTAASNIYYCAVDFEANKACYYSNFKKNAKASTMKKYQFASISMPVFMPPVKIGRKYYVDGGLVEFLPAMHAVKAPRFRECEDVILIDTLNPVGSSWEKMPTSLPTMLLQTIDKTTDSLCTEQAQLAYEQIKDVTGVAAFRISPSEKLPISFSLNFEPKEMKAAFKLGQKDGRKFVRGR